MSESKQCLQAMLSHITDMVCLMEYEDIKSMDKLVNMGINLAAQIESEQFTNECE